MQVYGVRAWTPCTVHSGITAFAFVRIDRGISHLAATGCNCWIDSNTHTVDLVYIEEVISPFDCICNEAVMGTLADKTPVSEQEHTLIPTDLNNTHVELTALEGFR